MEKILNLRFDPTRTHKITDIKLMTMKTKFCSGAEKPEYVSPEAYLQDFVVEGVLCISNPEDYTDNGGILGDNNWGSF